MIDRSGYSAWKKTLSPYQGASFWRSFWQLANSLIPYFILWYLMYLALSVSYWLMLPLAILAAGFLIRTFIISHDCGHGSFFRSRRANAIFGAFTSFLVFIPFRHWHWQHALHHATAGNLDRRGLGDVWMMTVQEYQEASALKRALYRLVRNPVLMFVLSPVFLFLFKERFPASGAKGKMMRSVILTNLAAVIWVLLLSLLFGFKAYLLMQLSVLAIAGSIGVWLFYVQHQFAGMVWTRQSQWNLVTAALESSSYYKLPRILHWFTGNIGYHHIHHLNPLIPNYKLAKCQNTVPELQKVRPITFWGSLGCLRFRLWDERSQKLVSFRESRLAVR